MKRLFADTFFFLAVLNSADPAHSMARRYYGKSGFRYLTTVWVLTEVADGMAAAAIRNRFLELRESLLDDPTFELIPADEEQWERGLKLYSSRSDKDWSLTDCISFVVMQERGLKDALTGDHHFEQAGFKALLK